MIIEDIDAASKLGNYYECGDTALRRRRIRKLIRESGVPYKKYGAQWFIRDEDIKYLVENSQWHSNSQESKTPLAGTLEVLSPANTSTKLQALLTKAE